MTFSEKWPTTEVGTEAIETGPRPDRPALRWFGGKWRLAPWIISHLPPHRIYVEPYGGAGSVLLRKPRSYAEVYNDLDGEVVNFFRVLRERGDELKEKLLLTPFAREEFVLSYEKSDDPLEQARRTAVRSFLGFGSNSHHRPTGFRANSSRSGTTPSGDWRNYPYAVEALAERLRGVTIENREAREVMAAHDSEKTLHYLDPPYVRGSRKDKRRDYNHDFEDSDHGELIEFCEGLKGMVVLSGYDSGLYDDRVGKWEKVSRKAYADGGGKRVECLWFLRCEPEADLFGRSGAGEVKV